MARPRKPPARRQNRATKDAEPTAAVVPIGVPDLELIDGGDAPRPDREWLVTTKREWTEFWDSALAAYEKPTDVASLRRLFDWRDQQLRCRRRAKAMIKKADEEPYVLGSTGQMKANPLYKIAADLEAQALQIEGRIVALEDRHPLSPKARLGLGVTEQKGMNLAAKNAELAAAFREAMQDGAPDPRAAQRDSAIEVAER